MIAHPLPETRFIHSAMPTTKGWLVGLGTDVYRVTTESVTQEYQNSFLDAIMFREGYQYKIQSYPHGYNLDRNGRIADQPEIVPKPETKLCRLNNSIDKNLKRFFKLHFEIQDDALLVTRKEKTKILQTDKIQLACVSRDENTILIITDQIIIMDNPLT